MNYRQQELYFRESQLWGAWCLVALIASGLWSAAVFRMLGYEFIPRLAGIQVAVLIAVAVSLYYTPDYLHLSISAEKPKAWAIKVRWRIVAAVLVLGALAASTNQGRLAAVIAALALAALNLLAARLGPGGLPAFFTFTDALVLVAVHFFVTLDVLTLTLLAAAIAHFSLVIVARERGRRYGWFLALPLLAEIGVYTLGVSWEPFSWVRLAPILVAILGTEFLRRRAVAHHRRDRASALQELVAYSGKTAAEVEALWRDSNRLLAENWKAAKLDENDHAAVKEWYRQNSSLYLYAISGHNLEYKKLVANMRMLRLAKGACLDYGAGNGELVLELAARGHAATYFDVDGETLRFARWRAEQRSLNITFTTTKEELRPGLDTIFSFDVLEHVPDLPAELTFLSSLLAKGGLLVCDVPAGATKNHPMHLNHELNVAEFLLSKGLRDRRTLWQRLTASEKYIFQA